MSLNFSNFTMKRIENHDAAVRVHEIMKGFIVKSNEQEPASTGDSSEYIDDDYSKINIISFNQSFSKLQKNYRFDK